MKTFYDEFWGDMDNPFDKFWTEYSKNLRTELTDEMKEGIRVVAWFAWCAGVEHEAKKHRPDSRDPKQNPQAVDAVIRSMCGG